MKTALPIGLFVLLVFGVTYLTQFTTTPPKPADDPGAAGYAGPPVLFGTTQMYFDPASPDPVNRHFRGFFELGTGAVTDPNWVPFFFQNPTAANIRVAAKERSCSKCTSARGTAISDDALNRYLLHAAAGHLWTPLPIPDLLTPLGWAAEYAKFDWKAFEFGRPETAIPIPPGKDGRPGWGLVELGFQITTVGEPAPVHVALEVFGEDGKPLMQQPVTLTTVFAGREPYEVFPPETNLGEMPEGSPPKSFEVYAYSVTRDFPNFPPPTMAMQPADPFVRVGPPVSMTPAELFALKVTVSGKNPMHVRSGYKYPVTVFRAIEGKSLDVGNLEKDIYAASTTSQKTYRVAIRGVVTGLLRLESGTKIELGAYNSQYEVKKTHRVWTDRPGVQLELLPDECTPRFVKYTLGEPKSEAGRTYWPIQLLIPAGQGRSTPFEGSAVLRTKGPNPVTVRVAVSGHGI